MAWVSVEDRLPEPGRDVPVHGDYTPEGVPKPRARIVAARDGFGIWDSREWRGTVGISYWWEEEPKER